MARKTLRASDKVTQQSRRLRLRVEQLEERAAPGSILDLFGWSLLGSGVLFLNSAPQAGDLRAVDQGPRPSGASHTDLRTDVYSPLPNLETNTRHGTGGSAGTQTAGGWGSVGLTGSAATPLPGSSATDDSFAWLGMAGPAAAGPHNPALAAFMSPTHAGAAGSVAPGAAPGGSSGGAQVGSVGSGTGRASSGLTSYAPPAASSAQAPAAAAQSAGVASSGLSGAAKNAALNKFGQSSVSFEANQGQVDSQVKFLARGSGYTLYLANSAVVMHTYSTGSTSARTDAVVTMTPVGANPTPAVIGQQPVGKSSNYMIGNDPANWHNAVPNFAQVDYQSLYPGIDMVFHGATQQHLEYDFVLAPHADPGRIVLNFQGANQVRLDSQGNLVLQTSVGSLVQSAPALYQDMNGARQAVSGRFVVHGSQVSFAVGSYDASRPLVIDPTASLFYGSYLGGGGVDGGYGVALDDGNDPTDTNTNKTYVYIVGKTDSTAFPVQNYITGQGSLHLSGTNITYDAFVTKLNIFGGDNGGGMTGQFGTDEWSTYLGGNGGAQVEPTGHLGEQATGVAWWRNPTTGFGYAYVVGYTDSSNFPVTNGTALLNKTSAFVSVLPTDGPNPNSTSRGVFFSTYVSRSRTISGQQEQQAGDGISVLTQGPNMGSAFISGRTFPDVRHIVDGAPPDGDRLTELLVAYVPTSGAPSIATFGGAQGSEEAFSVANRYNSAVSAYEVFLTGYTTSSDFPVMTGALQSTISSQDAFVLKLRYTSGFSVVAGTFFGGSNGENGRGIAFDPVSTAHYGVPVVWITGDTSSTTMPGVSGTLQNSAGSVDAFAAKINLPDSPTAMALDYGTYIGGSTNDTGYGVAIDAHGNTFVAGTPSGAGITYPAGLTGNPFNIGGAFVLEFTAPVYPALPQIGIYTKFGTTLQQDSGLAVAVSPNPNVNYVAVTGGTTGGNLDESSAHTAFSVAGHGGGDAMVGVFSYT
jgi:hypothetical protein